MAWGFCVYHTFKRQVISTVYQYFATIFPNNKYASKFNDLLLFMLFKD